jgi:hypothetical protein
VRFPSRRELRWWPTRKSSTSRWTGSQKTSPIGGATRGCFPSARFLKRRRHGSRNLRRVGPRARGRQAESRLPRLQFQRAEYVRFVTRSNVHIDRISTAWAITRFVDPEAAFVFVDRNQDVSRLDAIPFDMRGVELGHHAGRCSFEALLDKYELRDPALRRMGEIIRAIDMPFDGEPPADITRVASAFDALRASEITDDERLARGGQLCDELFRICGGDPR